MKRAHASDGDEPSFAEQLLRKSIKIPLKVVKRALKNEIAADEVTERRTVLTLPLTLGFSSMPGCVGYLELSISHLEFVSKPNPIYKHKQKTVEPFLGFVWDLKDREFIRWSEVCKAAAPGESFSESVQTDLQLPVGGVEVAGGHGCAVYLVKCTMGVCTKLFKGTWEEKRAKKALEKAAKALDSDPTAPTPTQTPGLMECYAVRVAGGPLDTPNTVAVLNSDRHLARLDACLARFGSGV